MPLIKIKHIVSCSSEDRVHKAENLLNLETYRKWKCATPGEKQASVVLQFEKGSIIHSIDIGNEASAFVEVFVGHSSDISKGFQVLLVTSSFMSPLEGRQGTNINRVRMFGPEKLSQILLKEKWDCVKIVCTQPFNKTLQYGLSFVKFHSPPETTSSLSPEENKEKMDASPLGAFKLKPEGEENDGISVGSWFAKRKEITESDPVTGPSSIREASSLASTVFASTKNHLKTLSKDQADDGVAARILPEEAVLWRKRQNEKAAMAANMKKDKEPSTPTKVDISKGLNKASNAVGVTTPIMEKKKREYEGSSVGTPAEKKAKGSKKEKPFHTLLEKVVFVLSGFQNPFRSELRDKALRMGAKYKGDWDNTCTHLICAFINTPKYNQVLAKRGCIVTKEWIIDCFKKKQLLPWKKYMLGSYSEDSSTEEQSDEETEESVEEVKEKKVQLVRHSPPQNKQSDECMKSCKDDEGKEKLTINSDTTLKSEDVVFYNASANKENFSPLKTDEDINNTTDQGDSDYYYEASTSIDSEESEEDTEDELLKVKQQTLNNVSNNKNQEEDHSTDNTLEDKPALKDAALPKLPDFFINKHFFIYGEFTPEERHMLNRCIIAYAGTLHNYMNEKIRYVVTQSKWNKDFDEALNENEDIVFVKPEWIVRCSEKEKAVPYQPFVVVPDG